MEMAPLVASPVDDYVSRMQETPPKKRNAASLVGLVVMVAVLGYFSYQRHRPVAVPAQLPVAGHCYSPECPPAGWSVPLPGSPRQSP